jgi:hypothetical protein
MKKAVRILRENKPLYMALNLLFYGSVVVGLFYGFLRPDAGAEMAKWGPSALVWDCLEVAVNTLTAPAVIYAFGAGITLLAMLLAILGGSSAVMAWFAFLGNLFLCTLSIALGLFLSPIVILALPFLTGIGFLWGAGSAAALPVGPLALLVHSFILAIEGQSIILAEFIMVRAYNAIFRPHRLGEVSRWSAYRRALGETGRLYMLIIFTLVVGAISHGLEWTYTEVSIEDINHCHSDSDCVVARETVCGGDAVAINEDYISVWDQHLKKEERTGVLERICATPRLDNFEAKCADTECVAVMKDKVAVDRAHISFGIGYTPDKPLLNKHVSLRFTFRFATDTPNVSARVELPDGFELVSGSLKWQGDLSRGEDRTAYAVVKATRTGYYQLTGTAIPQDRDDASGLTDTVHVEVTESDAIFGSKPENHWGQKGQAYAIPVPENNEQIRSELIVSPEPELNEEFTITYRVTPSIDIPGPQGTQMSLVLPPQAFEIVATQFPPGGEHYIHEDQLSWKGSISQDQTVEIKATLRIINTGWGYAYGCLSVQPGGQIASLITDVIIADLYVDKYSGHHSLR